MRLEKFNDFRENYIIESIKIDINFAINEGRDFRNIWDIVSKKVKNLSPSTKSKIIGWTIVSLLALSTKDVVVDYIKKSFADKETKEIAIKKAEEVKLKPGYEFVASQYIWDHIKKKEGFRLRAYNIGDGKITIGWGHAEPINKTKLRVGQKITIEKAKEYFRKDIKYAADGVRRIFKEWENEGINVRINQEMFDCLVSLAFNAGVSKLRQSEVIQNVKRGDFISAADSITTFARSKKFDGLEERRMEEKRIFLSGFEKK